MMISRYATGFGLFALLAVGAPAAAQERARFQDVDVNQDQAISRDEFAAIGGSDFEMLDKNGDNFISRAEVAEAAGDGRPDFSTIDRDRDGQVTRAEMRYFFGPAANATLRRYDRNGNGVVTRREIRQSLSTDPAQEPGADRPFDPSGSEVGGSMEPDSDASTSPEGAQVEPTQ